MSRSVFDIGPAGWYHLFIFGLLIPVSAYRSRGRLAVRPLPARRTHFIRTLVTLTAFALFSIVVARTQWIELFPARMPRLEGVVAGAVMLALMVTIMRPRWRRAVEKRSRLLHLFMPRTRSECLLWVALSAMAGFSEEVTWRGVQTVLMTGLVGNPLAAAVIVSAMFGLGHSLQGWRAAAIIAVFALGFQSIVWLSASLYVVMVVHFLYDVVAGLTYGRLGDELGYPVDPLPPVPQPNPVPLADA